MKAAAVVAEQSGQQHSKRQGFAESRAEPIRAQAKVS